MLLAIRQHVKTTSLRAAGLQRKTIKSAPVILGQRSFSTGRGDKVIFSGIQPTGVPHLGNYLGALRQWTDLQERSVLGDQLLYSIVDLHAITVPQDADQLRRWRKETLAILLSIGLDPERCIIFHQSAVWTQHDLDDWHMF